MLSEESACKRAIAVDTGAANAQVPLVTLTRWEQLLLI